MRKDAETEVIYQNEKALNPVQKLVGEAKAALSDSDRTKSNDKELNETMVAAGAVGAGAVASYAGLYFAGTTGLSAVGITSGLGAAGGLIGGGMTAGIAVFAAPAVILGIGSFAFMTRRNKKKLLEKKEMLLKEAQRKHYEIIQELSKKSQQTEERVEYLTRLNTLLQSAIHDLENDLKAAA